MNRPRIGPVSFPQTLGAVGTCCLLVAGCASPPAGNAPPAVVEQCQMEVRQLTNPDLPPLDESMPERPGAEADTIDEARRAKRELEGSSLATWPEEALLYRCFTSRGVVLTRQQAAVLAKWQQRTETTDPQ